MGKFRGRGDKGVERTLRQARPRPSDEFVDSMTSKVQASSPRRREWSRVSFAAALVVFMVGTFASFGGLGYAGSGAIGSVDVVKRVVVPEKHLVRVKVRTYSSASDEYGKVKTVIKTVTKPVVKAKIVGSKPTIKPTTAVKGATLPFTGFSLLGTVIAGLALVGLGLFLRRRESGSS
jgi:hypothetical protein